MKFRIVAAVVMVAVVFGALMVAVPPHLELNVEGVVDTSLTIEYGEEFKTPSAKAYYSDLFHPHGASVKVSVSGSVDTSKLGEYKLTYTASNKVYSAKKVVTVTVADTTAPVITLVTEPMQYTSPVGSYVEQGFTATDNYDGDLTSKVVRTETHDLVTYTVTDSSGNTTTVTRDIIYKDVLGPVITLNGSASLRIDVNSTYEEAGATAYDECDGDCTSTLTISGSVNTAKRGIYTLTYTAVDSKGNVGKATRTVKVFAPQADNPVVYPDGKVIYLTFDDGPCGYTPQLLDILDAYNVKATFFVCDKGSYNYLIGEAARRGHSIGVHTKTHDYAYIYSSEANYLADLEAMNDIIEAQTGSRTNLMRFPGGSSNTVSMNYWYGAMTTLTGTVQEMGYVYFDWNVSSGDAGGAYSASAVASNVIGGCSNNQYSVVLQHDIKGYSVAAVADIIEWGLSNGYTFLPLTTSSPTMHQYVAN